MEIFRFEFARYTTLAIPHSRKLSKCILKNNFALYGGAVFNRAINDGFNLPTIASSTFQDNKAYIDGADHFTDRDNSGINKPLFSKNVSFNSHVIDQIKMPPNTVKRMRSSQMPVKENKEQ